MRPARLLFKEGRPVRLCVFFYIFYFSSSFFMFCSVDFEREGELVPRPCVDGSFMMPNFSVKTTLIRTRNQRVVSWEKEAFLSLIDGLNCSCLRIFPQLSVHLKRVLECTRLSLFDGFFRLFVVAQISERS